MGGTAARGRAWLTAVWGFIRSAPLTYIWLAVLLVTTIVQHQLSRHDLHVLLVHHSTNIHHLGTDPLYVLFASLFWIDGARWLPCLVVFSLFLAPAEQWLGQIRWLTVGLTAHVISTYISEGVLYLAIQEHLRPERMVHVRDVGVSYFMVGVIAVFAYHIATPWRWAYLAILVVYYGSGLVTDLNFSAIGHVSAILLGLCFYPMARRRDAPLLKPRWVWREFATRSSSAP